MEDPMEDEEKWKVEEDTTVQVVEPMGTKKQEVEARRRNWASIIISLSIIVFVILMITAATLLMGPQAPPFYGRRLLMGDLYEPSLKPRPMTYQWLEDDRLAYISDGAGVRLLDLATGTNITLVTELALRQTGAEMFSVSPDLRYVLLCHDVIKGRLYTRTALYSVYHVATNHYYPLTLNRNHSTTSGNPLRLQHAQWASRISPIEPPTTSHTDGFSHAGTNPSIQDPSNHPYRKTTSSPTRTSALNDQLRASRSSFSSVGADVDKGNALVLLSNGSIFYMTSPSADPINLSPDADDKTLTYGAPNLLYQDIIQEAVALWSSPSGASLLVASFNDSSVRRLPVLHYSAGFPTVHELRYPTVETPLPVAALWLYDLSNPRRPPTRTRLLPPQALRGSDHYLVGGGWAVTDTGGDGEGQVWASWVGGDQATSALTLCTAPYWFCSTVLLNHRAGGVSPVLRGVQWAGKWAVFPWAAKDSQGSWHQHVALVGQAGGRRAPLTTPHYHVYEIVGASFGTQRVYFRGTEVSQIKSGNFRENIYRVSADGSNDVRCVTCNLRSKNVKFVVLDSSDQTSQVLPQVEEFMNTNYAGFDEWTNAITDIHAWMSWKKHENTVLVDDEEGEIGINGQKIYQKCRSVKGSLSPSMRYLAVICFDDNGVPPSLWLLDVGEGSLVNTTKSPEAATTVPQPKQIHSVSFNNDQGVVEELEEDDFAIDTGTIFGNHEAKLESTPEKTNSEFNDRPLLLHPQAITRRRMGVLGMPSTLCLGVLVTGNMGVEGAERGRATTYGVGAVYAHITLTVPPGWIEGDTTLLYPLVVQIVGPDEPSPNNEGGLTWAEYLASGHQTAHARIDLWGANPSAHTSAHVLAQFHVHAVRELLTRYEFLDRQNVGVYGHGGMAASAALEAAALTPALFRCTALINPITDWHANGVYWSERILGKVSQEGAEQRYVESNIARLAPSFRNGTPILLIHGTSDQFAHHGFSLAYALNAHAAHFSHVVYPNEAPSMLHPSRLLLAELEYFFFSWLHDPLIHEDIEGNIVEETVEEQLRRYENRFDIRRSFGKVKAS